MSPNPIRMGDFFIFTMKQFCEKIHLPLLQLLNDGQTHSTGECIDYLVRICTQDERHYLQDREWLDLLQSQDLIETEGTDRIRITENGRNELNESLRLQAEMSDWMEISLNALGEN